MCSLSEMTEIVSILLPYHFYFHSVKALGLVRDIFSSYLWVWLRVKSKKIKCKPKTAKSLKFESLGPHSVNVEFFLNKMIPLLRIFAFMNSYISSTLTGFVVCILLSLMFIAEGQTK